MPKLLQVLESVEMAAPIHPRLWLSVQRCLRASDHRGIQHAVVARDPLGETRHLWSTKVVGNVAHRQLESTVPVQRNLVARRQLAQYRAGGCRRKGRIDDQELDVAV